MTDRPVRLVQFTDTHLFANPNDRLCGLNTADSLTRVMELARADGLPAEDADARSPSARQAGWPPDAVLATGDLSQDETADSYRRFLGFFENIGAPVHCLPGNHDVPLTMAQIFVGSFTVHLTRWVDLGRWQVLLLNTVIPRDNAGSLSDEELDFLDRTLRGNPDRHALVCLHHNPVPVGSKWLDGMRLRNGEAFLSVIDRHPNVRGVVWGHVHQEFASERGKVKFFATPSTSLQFLPKSESFALDATPPGYRRIDLHPDGRIESKVRRLASYAYTPDLSTRGY